MSGKIRILIFIVLFPVFLLSKNDYYKIGNYPIIVLRGSPYEMGLAYGNYFNKELKQNILSFKNIEKKYLKRGFFLTKPFIKAKFRGKLKKISENIPEEYLKVLKGISLSSDINFKDIVFYNSFIDFLKSKHYTEYFITKEKNENIVGGNIYLCDDKIVSIIKPVILMFVPENGNRYLGFTFAGLTSVFSGLNENGIIVFSSVSESEKYSQISNFITNLLLQFSSSVEDAEKIMKKNKDKIMGTDFIIVSLNENKKISFKIKDDKLIKREIKDNLFPEIYDEKGEIRKDTDRKSLKIGLRLKELLSKGIYPEYILLDQIDVYSWTKNIIDDSINNQDTVCSFIIGKNRVLFSGGIGYAPHRQKIVFSPLDFFTLDIRGKIFKKDKLTDREKKILLFKINLRKIKSIKNKIKFLENLYSNKKYYEYYILKTKFLFQYKKYKKLIDFLNKAETEIKLNDTLLYYKYKAYIKLKQKDKGEKILKKLKENEISSHWIKELN